MIHVAVEAMQYFIIPIKLTQVADVAVFLIAFGHRDGVCLRREISQFIGLLMMPDF
jgi:hypothetical protein